MARLPGEDVSRVVADDIAIWDRAEEASHALCLVDFAYHKRDGGL